MPVNPKAHPPPTNTITGNMLALKLELRIAYHLIPTCLSRVQHCRVNRAYPF
jgi:hypothetical protein